MTIAYYHCICVLTCDISSFPRSLCGLHIQEKTHETRRKQSMNRPTCQHQQQQQNATPQLPPPAFMSDSDPWKSCDEDQEESSSKNAHRRAKRNIPETEKDDKYWEKRKRNNLAAKRSRENKRLLESDIRQKVALLEEQNALLRKEIVIIKARYGIPTEQSLLTPGEQAQCILEVKAAREANELRKKRENAGNIDDVSSTSPSVFSVGLHSSLDDSDAEKVCSESSDNSPKVSETTYNLQTSYGPAAYGPFNPSPSWAPAASSSQQGLASNSSGHPFSPSPGHQPKQSSTPSSYQAKHSSPFTRYGPGSMSGYPRPYDFYSMQYGNQSTPRIYEEGYPGAPADLRMNIKRQEEQRVCRGQTSLKSPSSQSDFLDDIAAMGYAHGGRPQIGQEQMRRQSADHTSVMSSGFSRLSCDLKNVNADGVKPIMQQDTKLELDLN